MKKPLLWPFALSILVIAPALSSLTWQEPTAQAAPAAPETASTPRVGSLTSSSVTGIASSLGSSSLGVTAIASSSQGTTELGAGVTPFREPSVASSTPPPAIFERSHDAGDAPDPQALKTPRQWRYTLHIKDGVFTIPPPRLVIHKTAIVTPRRFGRFAIELYVGDRLIDRVRFDIPMMDGDPGADTAHKGPPSLGHRVTTDMVVDVPDSERATYALFVDRLERTRARIPWPPVDEIPRVALPTEPGWWFPLVGHSIGLCSPDPIP